MGAVLPIHSPPPPPALSQGALRLALLDGWQRNFPLIARPFAYIAERIGSTEGAVLAEFSRLQQEGAISRIGAVWGAAAGGSAMLCAYAVPAAQIDAVAAQVSADPCVNHNYEREHHHNLWFVVTGSGREAVIATVDRLDAATGLQALRLPMRRAYRIDLGFAIGGNAACAEGGLSHAPLKHALSRRGQPVAEADKPLAALLEAGLPLVPKPYAEWADQWGMPVDAVLATLAHWQAQGTVRRLGVIVRHHELGISHNAMTVFNVPDAQVDAVGAVLACQPGVTLCYQRERAEGWPYNLYCMVHGRDRDTVLGLLGAARQAAGLQDAVHAVLFSRRRFKQQGARYFRDAVAAAPQACHACN